MENETKQRLSRDVPPSRMGRVGSRSKSEQYNVLQAAVTFRDAIRFFVATLWSSRHSDGVADTGRPQEHSDAVPASSSKVSNPIAGAASLAFLDPAYLAFRDVIPGRDAISETPSSFPRRRKNSEHRQRMSSGTGCPSARASPTSLSRRNRTRYHHVLQIDSETAQPSERRPT